MIPGIFTNLFCLPPSPCEIATLVGGGAWQAATSKLLEPLPISNYVASGRGELLVGLPRLYRHFSREGTGPGV